MTSLAALNAQGFRPVPPVTAAAAVSAWVGVAGGDEPEAAVVLVRHGHSAFRLVRVCEFVGRARRENLADWRRMVSREFLVEAWSTTRPNPALVQRVAEGIEGGRLLLEPRWQAHQADVDQLAASGQGPATAWAIAAALDAALQGLTGGAKLKSGELL